MHREKTICSFIKFTYSKGKTNKVSDIANWRNTVIRIYLWRSISNSKSNSFKRKERVVYNILMGTSYENDVFWRRKPSFFYFCRRASYADFNWRQKTSFDLTRQIWCFLTNLVGFVENCQFLKILKFLKIFKKSNFDKYSHYLSNFVKFRRFYFKKSN